jgi:hypothetical protein
VIFGFAFVWRFVGVAWGFGEVPWDLVEVGIWIF